MKTQLGMHTHVNFKVLPKKMVRHGIGTYTTPILAQFDDFNNM